MRLTLPLLLSKHEEGLMCQCPDLASAHPVLLSISLVNSKVDSSGSHQSHTTRSTQVPRSYKNMSTFPFNLFHSQVLSYPFKTTSKKVADMCIQYECHNCGSDLGDENSLILCYSYQQTLGLTSGNVQNCINYVRPKAGPSNLCAYCSAIDASAAESFPGSISSGIDHSE